MSKGSGSSRRSGAGGSAPSGAGAVSANKSTSTSGGDSKFLTQVAKSNHQEADTINYLLSKSGVKASDVLRLKIKITNEDGSYQNAFVVPNTVLEKKGANVILGGFSGGYNNWKVAPDWKIVNGKLTNVGGTEPITNYVSSYKQISVVEYSSTKGGRPIEFKKDKRKLK